MKPRPARVDAVVELGLAVLSLHVFLLALLRQYGLESLGIPLVFREPLPALLSIMGLCLVRWRLGRRGGGESLSWRERLVPGHWLHGMGLPGLVLTFSLLAALYLFQHYGGRLGNDGSLLYIYVRSLVMDGDLDFTNEFEDFVPEKFQFIAEQARSVGKTPDPLSEPGPAVLWAPWFVAAHVVVRLARSAGSTIPADGYSYPYINAVCLGSLVWAFVAVVLSYRAAARYFSPTLAAACASFLWFGTMLFWYSIYNPSMPHAVSAAAVAGFLAVWLRFREAPSKKMWLALGLAAGLILSIQRYNVFYLVAPFLTIAGWAVSKVWTRRWTASRGVVSSVVLAVLGFLLMVAPLVVYNVFYTREGTLFRWGQSIESHYLRYWKTPRIGEFLFSSNHGLFSWTPLVYLSVIGLLLFLKKDRRVGGALLLTLAAGVYLLSSTWDWYAGASFGSRRMTGAFFIFAMGLCALADLAIRRPRLLAAVVVTPLLVWNFLLAEQLRRGDLPEFGTFSFGEAGARGIERLQAWMGYPGAAPANWLFAHRYGVSPERFDRVYGHRPYHDLDIDVGSHEDLPFLGMGWSIPEGRGDGVTYRWSLGEKSSWLVPLFAPYDYRLTLRGGASRHPRHEPQVVSIAVNGDPVRSLLWPSDMAPVHEILVPAAFWKEGLNTIEFKYAWSVEAGEVYGGSDERRIAIWLDRLKLRIDRKGASGVGSGPAAVREQDSP